MVASVLTHSEVNQADLNLVLNPKHQRELIHKRGLNPDWIAVNCKSVDAKTASEHLGYKAYSGGILLTGDGYQEQFKPDDPWKSEDGKRPKYRSCRDEDGYDAMLPRHPENPHYWDDLEALKRECYQIDGKPCLVVTEGLFKSISLTSHGTPTVALLGVEMGLTSKGKDPEERRYLVETLRRFADAKFGFIIGLDADCASNDKVKKAQEKLGNQLSLFTDSVYSITGLWHEAEGKGIDDYIQGNGYEKFRDKVLSKAETFEQWKEKHLDSLERQVNQGSKTQTPNQKDIANEIAEEYENKLAFNDEVNTWMRYEAEHPGVWSPETDRYIRSIISQVLEGKGVKFKTQTYVKQVIECLEVDSRILKRKWLERSPNEVLPHHNGVLEIATGKLLEHSPLNYLTWTLPRKHDPDAKDWEKINTWLDQVSQGNLIVKNLLICFANAVLKGRSDLQKMMHLIGLGGSGKTTYSNLITDLIGENNVLDEGVEQFCTNRFTPIRAYQKRLVLFSDEQDLPKNISNIMKLVGGNNLTGEQKGKPAFQFRYSGMAMLVSEHPIAQGIKGNGWKRRIIPLPMNLKVADKDRRDLRAEFQPELAAFTNYLLSLSDEFVTQTLKGVGDIPECRLQFWQSRLREDSLAAWLNDCVIYDPSIKTAVGSNKNEADGGDTPKTLFGSYANFCKRSGMSPKSVTRFSPELVELCQSGLGWNVNRIRNRSAVHLSGIRLRVEGKDDDILTHEQSLTESVKTQGGESAETKAKAETQTGQGRVECVDLSELSLTTTSENSDQPENPPEAESQFKVGERVILLHDGRIGEVIEVNPNRHPGLKIRLDNSVEIWERPEHLELAPPKKPEPEPQKDITLKPALVEGMTLEQKRQWLHNNQGTNKPVWVKIDKYEGEAKLKGKTDSWDKWKVYIPDNSGDDVVYSWGNDVVSVDCIEILHSQLGKFKLPPKPPEGDQIELNFDAPPQTETPTEAETLSEPVTTEAPKKRFKRLAKLAEVNLNPGNFAIDNILEEFGKSDWKELTDKELTEIADKWERQIADKENFQRESSFLNRLNKDK